MSVRPRREEKETCPLYQSVTWPVIVLPDEPRWTDAEAKCVRSVMVLVTVLALVLVSVSAEGRTRTCQSAVPRRTPAMTLKPPDASVCPPLSLRQAVEPLGR